MHLSLAFESHLRDDWVLPHQDQEEHSKRLTPLSHVIRIPPVKGEQGVPC